MRLLAPKATLSDRIRSGMTLVELLLAITIAVVAVALAFSLFRTVSMTLQGQAEREHGGRAALGTLDHLRDDLLRAFVPDGAAGCGFILTPSAGDTNQTDELSFCTLVPGAGESEARWSSVVRLHYRAKSREEGAAPQLLRVEEAMSGPEALEPARTNISVESIRRFEVLLWDGSTWRNEWSADSPQGAPRAARVHLLATSGDRSAGAEPLEIYIPAGMVVTSSFERAGASSPPPSPGAGTP
jgi:prepilin-type N-terminal cleavage/methylation domain-containing protein